MFNESAVQIVLLFTLLPLVIECIVFDMHRFLAVLDGGALSSVKCDKSAPKKSSFMSAVSSLKDNGNCIAFSALEVSLLSRSEIGLLKPPITDCSSDGESSSLRPDDLSLARLPLRAPGADLKLVFSKMIVLTGGVVPSRRFLSCSWPLPISWKLLKIRNQYRK